jgi:hypothetical protein
MKERTGVGDLTDLDNIDRADPDTRERGESASVSQTAVSSNGPAVTRTSATGSGALCVSFFHG